MTRFIPSEEIDQQSVRQWHFGNVRSSARQGFMAMPEMTLDPLLTAPVQPEVAEPAEAEAVVEAEQAAPAQEAVPAPVVPMFTEEELQQHVQQAAEQARAEAYQQGLQQGQQEAAHEWQQRMADYQNNVGREAAQRLNEVLHAAAEAVQGLQ